MNGTDGTPRTRSIRIGNVSGATGAAPHALARMVREGNVDVITGDWLSEMNIAWNAITKAENPDLGYEIGFYNQLSECIDEIVEKGIEVVTNAGALNAPALTTKIEHLCKQKGEDGLVVATVIEDDVSSLETSNNQSGLKFQHLDHEEQSLKDWIRLIPSCAAAHIAGHRGRSLVAWLEQGRLDTRLL